MRAEADWNRRVEPPNRDSPLKALDPTSKPWDVIFSAQPFHAGADADIHPLAALSQLSNNDKHRVLNATYTYAPKTLWALFRWNMFASFITAKQHVQTGAPLENGARIASFYFDPQGPDPELRVNNPVTLALAFGTDPVRQAGDFTEIHARVARIFAECKPWL